MKKNVLFIILLALSVLIYPSINVALAQTPYTIIKIADSPTSAPHIDAGLVTWSASDGHDDEIFLYDHSTSAVIQITDNNHDDRQPQIHAGQVTWQGSDGTDREIFLYDYASDTITQITDNSYHDENPQIHSGLVTWQGNNQIFLYDSSTLTIVTVSQDQWIYDELYPDTNFHDENPQIHNGIITWTGECSDGPHYWRSCMFIYDYNSYTYIPLYGEFELQGNEKDTPNHNPNIHNGMITWWREAQDPVDEGKEEIFLYDYNTKTKIKIATGKEPLFRSPKIHGGMITWYGYYRFVPGFPEIQQIFLYDYATNIRIQITDSSYPNIHPQIHDGQISWQGSDGQDNEIFLYDYASDTITQITDNSYDDRYPDIHNGMITWLNELGVFLAFPTNQPPVAEAGPNQTVVLGETVTFNGLASYDPDGILVAFAWDFGDAETGVGETTSYTYTSAGTYDVTLTVTDNNGATTTDTLTVVVLTPEEATEDQIGTLQDLIDDNVGTSLADKLEDAQNKTAIALDELTKTPPDNQAAIGNIEGAIGDIEATVEDGLLDPASSYELMNNFAAIARQLAADTIDEAIVQGGDTQVIEEAQQALEEGDALRASGAFKDAVNKYKDALSKAESALP